LDYQCTTGIPPLHLETRAAVDTRTAAFHLSRKPKTLRVWATAGNGPLLPRRVGGRLSWSVAGIRKLLEGDTAASS
jgi:hypothetical protein